MYKIVLFFCLLQLYTAGVSYSTDTYDIPVSIDNSLSDQYNPRMTSGSGGNIAVTWTDKRNGNSDIYCQIIDTSGVKSGSNRRLNDDLNSTIQLEAAVVPFGEGNYMAVWRDYRNGDYPFGPDIFAAVLDSTNIDNNINITPDLADVICETPDIAKLSDGSAVVVWADYRNSNWDIYGQRLSSAAAAIGESFKINSGDGTGHQHAPRIAASESGGFVVAWYDNRLGDDDIFFQRFDSSAAPIGANVRASDDLTGARQAFPDVACDGSGRFFIAWVDWKNGIYPANPDIYMRRFDSSGSAIASAKKINRNDNSRAQRDVALCSDYMGNVCVVWADSVTGQYDVMAQIIDRDGLVVDNNFMVHEEYEGRQVQPDVATDGYKLLFCWADYRAGDFDIYMTVKDFNNPGLIPGPANLNFTMEQGGSLPASQTVNLTNNGLGELNWSALAETDWLSVSPLSGVTPADIQISITTDTLPYGTYSGHVRLIDQDYIDSSRTIPVTLSVTAPLLDLSPDTLYYRILKKLGDPDPMPIVVSNSGSGILTWNAVENADWISLDVSSGIQGDSIRVSIQVNNLEPGESLAPVEFSSSEAVNSPDTVWVKAEMLDSMSYIDPVPDSLVFYAVMGDTLEGQVQIENPGDEILSWTAVAIESWLEIDRASGTDNDIINVTIETAALSTGYHHSGIMVYDSASFNIEVFIPIDIYLSSGDTVQFMNTNVMPYQLGLMPVYITLIDSSKGGYVPFGYDSSTAALDSIVFNEDNLPDFVDYYSTIVGGGAAEFGWRVNASDIGDSSIPAATYHIADLFFTAGGHEVFNTVDSTSSDSSGIYILGKTLANDVPSVISGDLIIGNPTGVTDNERPLLPNKISLEQNYPNPFNASTKIQFRLPKATHVTLKIFNILGQEIGDLQNGLLAAGEHSLIWDGRLNNSLPAPSGIYFYRLAAADFVDVRKMVLIK